MSKNLIVLINRSQKMFAVIEVLEVPLTTNTSDKTLAMIRSRICRLIFALATLGLTACQVAPNTAAQPHAANSQSQEINWVKHAIWNAKADSYGSRIELPNSDLKSHGVIAALLHQTPAQAEHPWPFAELICALPQNLSGTQQLVITYKASQPLHIKLSQSDFSHLGDSSYAHFAAIIPRSETWNTVHINIADFQQPHWTPDESKAVGLTLEHIEDIYISPNFGEQGGDVDLEISHLILR